MRSKIYILNSVLSWAIVVAAAAVSALSFYCGNERVGIWSGLAALFKLEAIVWHRETEAERKWTDSYMKLYEDMVSSLRGNPTRRDPEPAENKPE